MKSDILGDQDSEIIPCNRLLQDTDADWIDRQIDYFIDQQREIAVLQQQFTEITTKQITYTKPACMSAIFKLAAHISYERWKFQPLKDIFDQV